MKPAAEVIGWVACVALLGWLALHARVVSQGQEVGPTVTLPQVGIRHSRIVTDTGLGLFRLGTNQAGAAIWIPASTNSLLSQAGMQPYSVSYDRSDLNWGINAAEAINAKAMNDWQRRFQIHLLTPRAVPVLYPIPIERRLEHVK